MKHLCISRYYSLILILSLLILCGCNSNEDTFDENYIPSEKDIAEVALKAKTNWGMSKDGTKKDMKGFILINEDENTLKYSSSRMPVTIAYKFASNKLCASLICFKKGESLLDVSGILDSYNSLGEYGANTVLTNEKENVLALSYERDSSMVIGFTPFHNIVEKVDGHDCVDLGLNMRWATCNIGAETPESYGEYYAWGETQVKDSYEKENYNFYQLANNSFENIGDSICGTKYDVAMNKWGKSWSIPSSAQLKELTAKCKFVWTTIDGIKGCRIFGESGNYIFLPCSGYKDTLLRGDNVRGYYMSANTYNESKIQYLNTSSNKNAVNNIYRYVGVNVRPVTK